MTRNREIAQAVTRALAISAAVTGAGYSVTAHAQAAPAAAAEQQEAVVQMQQGR